MTSETPCPDLVGQPGLTEQFKKSRPQLYSSLPDVSSIGHSDEVGMQEDSSHKSTESLNFQPTGRQMESAEGSDEDDMDDMDLGALDSELDAQLEQNHPGGHQRIPDCIVESVMNEDHHGDERPVAFSESIGQRVRRERPSRRSDFDRMEPADLVKDTNQSDNKAREREKMKEEEAVGDEIGRDEGEMGMPKMLDFIGDWPSEGSLEQRQVKRRERHKEGDGKEDGGVSEEANQNTMKVQSGPDVKEFQKFFDLIQTGATALQTGSSRSSYLSPISGRELEREVEAGGRRSNSEEREKNMNGLNSCRAELPDCVLDWKAADSCVVRESRIDGRERLQIENEVSNTTVENDKTGSVDVKSTTLSLSVITADSLVISETIEAKVCHSRGSHNEGGVGTEPGAVGYSDMDTNNCTHNCGVTGVQLDSSHIGEVCQSPVCEDSVEAESSAFSGGSQERKQRQGRRSGKQCKLALTFTQNCPASSLTALECPITAAQNVNSSQNSFNMDIEPNASLNLKPNIDLFTESISEAHLQTPCPLLVNTGSPTQTEPQDFALLWRLNHQDSPDDAPVTACGYSGNITVLSGDSSRFVPELSSAVSAAVAVHPSGHNEVPYRVVHEKGTQVEEREFGATRDRLESLRILSRHFKLVSFDTLEDLYDKCHHDLEWTTNLLLDSGERFFRDEEVREEEEGARGEDDWNTSNLRGALGKVVKNKLPSNVLHELHSEVSPNATGVVEVTQQSACETVSESGESSDNTDLLSVGSAASPVRNKNHPETPSHSVKPSQTEHNLLLSEKREKCDSAEHKVTSEPEFVDGAWGESNDDAVIIEESRVEIDDEIASMDEVNRVLQAELDEMEREGKHKERNQRRHVEERRSHLDIQSVELKLPTELALQLTELFGPVGVDPGNHDTVITLTNTF